MLPSRQIHLDFHTSEHISNVGKTFSKDQFKNTLLKAKVNGINLFAKCHHSWSYYPTKVGKMHPNLNFDLLGSQIEACKEANIRPYIYFTMGWSSNDAEDHPEWCAREKNDSYIINSPKDNPEDENLPHFHWKFMCLNNGYHELIYSQVKELCESYNVDGFWFDIYQVHRICYCNNCKKQMLIEGIDLENSLEVEAFNGRLIKKHCSSIKSLIKSYMPNANVFFNGTTATDLGSNFKHEMYIVNTAQDLEHLPTTWGGYDKLSIQSKYFLSLDYSITAMSGKFHTDWGEFGGFKHPDAIKYEAAAMIAHGANCNIGDQLHPLGEMNLSTYKCIQPAYEYVEKIEAYGLNSKPCSNLGVWRSFDETSDNGMANMLLEEHLDFNYINHCNDLSAYSCLIFTSRSELCPETIKRVKNFIKDGGSVVCLGASIMHFTEDNIAKDFGIQYIGNSDYDSDYTSLIGSPIRLYSEGPFLNYLPGLKTKALESSIALAKIHNPSFNRTEAHFCSHQKTPYEEKYSASAAVVINDNCLFFSHELDVIYASKGSRLHRSLFKNSIDRVYQNPYVKIDLPSTARINVLDQIQNKRYILHILYGPPIQRGNVSVLEDFPELNNINIRFKFPKNITRIYQGHENNILNSKMSISGYHSLELDSFNMHDFVVFNY